MQAVTPAGEETGLFDLARYEAEQKRRSEARQDIKAAHKAVLAASKRGQGEGMDDQLLAWSNLVGQQALSSRSPAQT